MDANWRALDEIAERKRAADEERKQATEQREVFAPSLRQVVQ